VSFEMAFKVAIEVEREDDGRWIADAIGLPGVVAYGNSREEAVSRAEAIALRVLADKIEEEQPEGELNFSFSVA